MVPTAESVLSRAAAEYAHLQRFLPGALDAVRWAAERLEQDGVDFAYAGHEFRPYRDELTLRLKLRGTVRTSEELAILLRRLAERGIRREKDERPFDCAETMQRLYDMRLEDIEVSLFVNLAGSYCRRVPCGTAPVYRIECGESVDGTAAATVPA